MEEKINMYTCQVCGRKMITQDKDEGVTPFMIECDVDKCEGLAHSSFYRFSEKVTSIDYFWKKLTDDEIREHSKRDVQYILSRTPDWAIKLKENTGVEAEEFMFRSNKEHADKGGLFKVKNV